MRFLTCLLTLPALLGVVLASPDVPGIFSYLLKPEFRKNQGVVDALVEDLKKIAKSPSEKDLYASKSVHLGTFMLTVWSVKKRGEGQPFYDAHKDKLLAFQDISEDKSPQAPEPKAVTGPTRCNGRNRPDTVKLAARAIQSDQDALPEMMSISQPPGLPWEKTPTEFYYDDSLGKGTVIYVIDSGAELDLPELHGLDVDPNWIWAGPRRATGDKTDGDKKEYHGTGVLGKVAGRQTGIARKARIVVVRIRSSEGNQPIANGLDALLQTYDDIKARYSTAKVVVNMSWDFGPVVGNDGLNNAVVAASEDIMKEFVALGNVLLVTAAGNARNGEPIDGAPALNGATVPELIVVTGTDPKGTLKYQTAPYVKIAAVADFLCVASKGEESENGWAGATGTSFAAPVVAGLLAYFMGMGATMEDARQTLHNNAWPRLTGGTPMVWNGVDSRQLFQKVSKSPPAATPKAPVPTSVQPATPSQSCYGLGANKYITRDTAKDLIEQNFCPEAVKQGGPDSGISGMARTYLRGTPEEVQIAIGWKSGSTTKVNIDDCQRFLRTMALDGCDGNNPNNPMNWKGGATVQVGDVSYYLDPLVQRQPAPKSPGGGCHTAANIELNTVEVWGNGWSNSDSGAKLKDQLKRCGAYGWQFSYGLGNNGREWTAKFDTAPGLGKCIEQAAQNAGAQTGFVCHGTT